MSIDSCRGYICHLSIRRRSLCCDLCSTPSGSKTLKTCRTTSRPRSNKTVLIDEFLMHRSISEKASTPPQFLLDWFYNLIQVTSTPTTCTSQPSEYSFFQYCLNEIPIPFTLTRNNAISGAVSPRLKQFSIVSSRFTALFLIARE